MPGWPRGREVRGPEHDLIVWRDDICPAGAKFRGFALSELCSALCAAT